MPTFEPKQVLLRSLPICLLIALTTLLYLPYLHNSLVFDDHNLFSRNGFIFDFAATPFNRAPRTFPLFTLAFVEVVWRDITVHRTVSLFIHCINAILIYRLSKRLLAYCCDRPSIEIVLLALIAALFFSLHPVATYGAGYLAQRTILLATTFSLLSLWFFWRSLEEKRLADSVTAAAFYAIAIFCKEHALLLPLAAIWLALLRKEGLRPHRTALLTYLLLSILAASYVIADSKGLIGQAYERNYETFQRALPQDASTLPATVPAHPWFDSITTQAGAFFTYLHLWWWPDTAQMSIDLRPPLGAHPSPWITLPAYCCTFLLGLALLLRKNPMQRLTGSLMLICLSIFACEFSTVRQQEILVLYRSYLWGFSLALLFACGIAQLPIKQKGLIAICVAISIALIPLGRNRLTSMATEMNVWRDAAKKLESDKQDGAARIYYNLAIQEAQQGDLGAAQSHLTLVIGLEPMLPHPYAIRGRVALASKDYPAALKDFDQAIELNHPDGSTTYFKALALQGLGKKIEACQLYSLSKQQGYFVSQTTKQEVEIACPHGEK